MQVDGASTRFYRSDDRMTWRVQLPGGERLEFGSLRADTGVAATVPDAVERDLQSFAGLVRWRLVGHIDPQHPKNVVVYRWEQALPGDWLLILKDIYYTPAVTELTNLSAFAHHVQLDWESPAYQIPRYLGVDGLEDRHGGTRLATNHRSSS